MENMKGEISPAGHQFQADGTADFSDVPDSSSLRAGGLEGKHRHRAVLDFIGHLRPARTGHAEVEIRRCATKIKKSLSWEPV